MASTPNFPSTPRANTAVISSGNTARVMTGTTGTSLLITAGSSGTKIDQVVVKATGTTTAGCIRLYLFTGSGNATLIDEITVPAVTPAATDSAYVSTKTYNHLHLPAGNSLYVSTHNSESFVITAFGGDF
jgi:hypothetical protein